MEPIYQILLRLTVCRKYCCHQCSCCLEWSYSWWRWRGKDRSEDVGQRDLHVGGEFLVALMVSRGYLQQRLKTSGGGDELVINVHIIHVLLALEDHFSSTLRRERRRRRRKRRRGRKRGRRRRRGRKRRGRKRRGRRRRRGTAINPSSLCCRLFPHRQHSC